MNTEGSCVEDDSTVYQEFRQHRTKTALRLSATALHKFRQPISVRLWLRFLGRHLICLHIFRHLAQKSLDIRQYAFGISVQSDKKSDSASAALSLCGIAFILLRYQDLRQRFLTPLRAHFLRMLPSLHRKYPVRQPHLPLQPWS